MHLSAPQKNVLETELYFKNTSIQNIGGYMCFEKEIDYDTMNKAYNQLLKNADGLRIKITRSNNEYSQEIKEYKYEKLENVGNIEDIDSTCDRWMRIPFNVYEKMYAFRFFKHKGKCGLSIILHHLISDAWSITLVVSRLLEYYDSFLSNKEVPESLPSYNLFLEKEQEYLKSDKFLKDEKYWDEKFNEKPAFVSFAKNHAIKNPVGNRKYYKIEKSFRDKIEKYCLDNSISVPIFFEAILAVYGARTNNQDEITLCSLGLNRSSYTLKNTIGNFSNILPMRVKIDWNESFLKLCKNISSEHFDLFSRFNLIA